MTDAEAKLKALSIVFQGMCISLARQCPREYASLLDNIGQTLESDAARNVFTQDARAFVWAIMRGPQEPVRN